MKARIMDQSQNVQGLRYLGVSLLMAIGLVLPGRWASGQELVLNGGFELNGGSGTIPTDWNLIVNSYGAWNGYLPHGGSWFIHVGGSGQPGGEYQDIATVAGLQYNLSFWAMPAFTAGPQRGIVQAGTPGADNTSLTLNNNAEYVNNNFDVSGAGAWTPFNFTFTAGSSVTRISFQNSFFSAPLDSAVNVDDVSVTVVPEPGSAALLGVGLAAIGVATRRRAM